jgi:hypothetical protein
MGITGVSGRNAFQIQSILSLRSKLDDLQRQLGTGIKSNSYAGLGLDRGLSMALRGQVAALTSFSQTSTIVGTRLSIAQNVLTQVDASVHLVKNSSSNTTFTFDKTGQTSDQQTAYGQLDQVLSALNSQVGDQYLFSGMSPNVAPVDTLDHILNGNGTQAGLTQLISERKQADLGTSGLGRVTIPAIVSSAAVLTGTGATIVPDAAATVTGSGDVVTGPFASAGGTLVLNGTTINIGAGDDSTAILAAINAPATVTATGVTATLVGNNIKLTSADPDTAITVGAGSTVLGELGLSATTTNPTNLLTQGALPGVVTAGQTLTVTIGARPPLTITFGTNGAAVPPEVSTLAELNAQIGTLVGNGAASASASLVNGNISITTSGTGEAITIGGNANAVAFGLSATTAAPSNAVSISEDAAGHPFGMKLLAYTSSLTGSTVTTGGPPASYSVNMATNPNAGDSITFSFTLPDGTTAPITLKATTSTPPGDGEFTIGATSDVTAANLRTALTTQVTETASTALVAASALKVSDDFFSADSTHSPQRVNGPPFDTATAMMAGTTSNTVTWYKGEMSSTPARQTAAARVDSSITVSYGMRANEEAFRNAISNMAVFASTTFSASDPNSTVRYEELTKRVGINLAGVPGTQRVTDIEAEVANAQSALKAATDRHQQTNSALNGMLDTIQGVSTEQVGTEILALQTRLQASLQTTALLAKTSLVNYLS